MKQTLLLCLLLLLAWGGRAQTVTAPAGGEGRVGAMNVAYTVGEAFVATLENGGNLLSQGFHQPKIAVTAVQEAFPPGAVRAFPNPTADVLHVQFKDLKPEDIAITLLDLSGKILLRAQPSSLDWQADLSKLPGATYLLQVSDTAAQRTHSFNIVKSN
jgi:hypothetical protein